MNESIESALKARVQAAPVSDLDFTRQSKKMVEVLGWSAAAVTEMERLYRQFLALSRAVQDLGLDMEIVPNRMIDEFWHMHILDTRQYHEDCEKLFGRPLHHYPYFGLEDETDARRWQKSAKRSDQLWQAVFGECLYGADEGDGDAYIADRALHARLSQELLAGDQVTVMRCRTGCKPMKCK